MIKGINRQVVEVRETGSDYFERILFFVRPEYASVSEGKIRERASLIAGKSEKPPVTRRKKEGLRQLAMLIASAVLGFCVGVLIMNII